VVLREPRREHLYDIVAREIQRYIAEAGLQPGDKLPSERELCEQLRVGRTTVREALRRLQEMRLIRIQVGRGSFVREYNLDEFLAGATRPLLRDAADLRDLAEAREFLETHAICLAAQRRSQAHLDALHERLERDRRQVQAGAAYMPADDAEFHKLLLEAAGNKVLLRFVSIISELMRSAPAAAAPADRDTRTMDEHQALYEAVRDQKPELAVQRMRAHVRGTAAALLSRSQAIFATHDAGQKFLCTSSM